MTDRYWNAQPLRPGRGQALAARTLVATVEGIHLWPATLLTRRAGAVHILESKQTIYDRVGLLHGPGVIESPLIGGLMRAIDYLNRSDLEAADRALKAIALPPITASGLALIERVGQRLGVHPPAIPRGHAEGARWSPQVADAVASGFEQLRAAARRLQKGLQHRPASAPPGPRAQ